jgi:hypothetical protein
VVNKGSHVFRWGIDSIDGGDENMPAMLMFRHIFELIDSVSILVRSSSIEPANIILRSLFESYMNFEYLLEKDFKSRSMDFLVCSRHREILKLRRFDPNDEMHAQYEALRARDKISKDIPPKPVPDVAERIEAINKVLELPTYRESNDGYERTRTVKGKAPKYWYNLHDGPRDACQLADSLDLPLQYDVLYRTWSELVHGTDILDGKITAEGPGLVSFSPLRVPSKAPFVTLMTVAFGLSTIRLFTQHYVPDKAKSNADWYHKEIEDLYLRLNDIKIIVH